MFVYLYEVEKMKRFFVFLFIFILYSCSAGKEYPEISSTEVSVDSLEEADSIIMSILKAESCVSDVGGKIPDITYRNLSRAFDYVYRMKDTARSLEFNRAYFSSFKNVSADLASLCAVYAAVAYFNMNEKDSTRFYLDYVGQHISPESYIYGMYNNTMATYCLKFEMNYPKAMHYLMQAENHYEKKGSLANKSIILSNISTLYLLKKDTSGFRYAEEGYEVALQSGHPYAVALNAFTLVRMYELKGEYDKALVYAEKAMNIVKSNKSLKELLAYTHLLYANVYLSEKNHVAAKNHLEAAVKELPGSSDMENTRIIMYKTFGDYYYIIGQYDRAKSCFMKALGLSSASENIDNIDEILNGLALSYAKTGMADSSIYYFSRYTAVKDSIFNIHKENEFNQIFMENENLRHEKELQQKEMKITQQRYVVAGVSLAVLLSTALLIVTYIMYRRKEQMYSNTVMQYENYRKKIAELKLGDISKIDSKNKSELELFNRLEDLMGKEKIYRQKDISLDRLADMLKTNRTYLSNVVNKYAGVSLPKYINSYRIQEAISLVADTEKDIVLKAICEDVGYSSITSFYRAFQNETGCSPMIYRDRLMKMQKQSQNQ